MKHTAISFLIVLLSLCALPDILSAQQQGLPVDGKDFYIGMVIPSFNKNPTQAGRDFHGFFGTYVLISSYTENTFTISYFDANGNESTRTPYQISAKRGMSIPLSQPFMRMSDTSGDVAEYKACHITAKKPINVQYFSTGACSGGSYLSIPTPALGKNYVIPSYNDNPGTGAGQPAQAENAGGFFLIIGAFDGTSVTIIPNGATAGGHIGVNSGPRANGSKHPYTIGLNRGQCYLVKGDGSSEDNDMSGSTVVSNNPIGVLAGHENAFIGEAPSNRTLEGRDFMIEQVIPSEYWDSTGYVSIPMVPATPADETATGYGQNYRAYTNDPRGTNVEENDCITSQNSLATSLYASPTPEKSRVGCPIEMHSTDGHKFGVMCYEQRDQGNAEPYPTESMMSIVPMSRWRTSYLFFVPANTFELLQDYYINVIGEKNDIDNNIVFSHDGSGLGKISSLSIKGSFPNIPNHPELKGVRLAVHPGSYYLTNQRTKIDPRVDIDTMLQGAFIVYHYGMRAIDPDRDLGDFCGDDFFFSYALPIGMTVSAGGGNPVADVKPHCSSWTVCVHDSIPLASATLIDDPFGDVYGRPGKVKYNVNFDGKSDPNQTGEIIFNGVDTSVCFDILVSNPFDTAYAPLYIIDKNGYHLNPVVELHYKAPTVQELLYSPQSKPSQYIKIDTLTFPQIRVADEACSTLVFINTSPKGSPSFTIQSASIKTSHFKISSTNPSLPTQLLGGDTLKVEVCFDATDTLTHFDSVIIKTDCFDAPLLTVGRGGTPLIYATDWDFGSVTVGTTSCHDVTIFNKGNLPFTLTKNWLLHNSVVFSLSPASAAILPYVLKPGGFINMSFCYSPAAIGPQDSTTVDWATDIESPFTNTIKSWSYLKGTPIKPGLIWDRPTELDSVICEDSIVVRVRLINHSSDNARNVKVFIDGPDAAEYAIVGDSLGYTPLSNFNMAIGQVIWIDVLFKADLTKTPRYAPRHANLVATWLNSASNESDSTVIKFTDLVQHADLAINPQHLDLGFVTKGDPQAVNVTLINNGDAPFVLKATDFPNPPITGISLNGKQLSPGDTIFRGDTVTLLINAQLDTYADTTVNYTLFSDHACGDITATVQMAASQLKVLATDYPAPDVFIGGCREHDSTVIFFNKGSVLITLDSVDISNAIPPGQFELVDSKGNRGTSLTIGKKLLSLENDTIAIVYHPTVTGPASATIRFVYDSAGTKYTITTKANGDGVQLQSTISAAQASGKPYSASTVTNFAVPISITSNTKTALPANADARRVTFRLTYVQDVVNFSSVALGGNGNYLWTSGNPPKPVDPGANVEYIDFDIASASPITNLEDIATIQYQAMIAQGMITPFTISNIQFYDSKNVPICYIVADSIPGEFIPDYLCGDTTLHKFLLGTLPTRIAKLSPSVLTNDETPILYYSINRSDLPLKVELYNVLGDRIRVVKNTASQPAGDYKLPIGTRDLPSGSYIVRLTTSQSSQSANFIMQK